MRAFDFPFLRIEVVGAVADVFHEAEGLMAVGDEGEAARHVGREHHSLFPQVADGLVVAQFRLGKGFAVEGRAEGQRHVGNKVFAFHGA